MKYADKALGFLFAAYHGIQASVRRHFGEIPAVFRQRREFRAALLFSGEIRFIPALGAELPGELHLVDSEVAQYCHGAAVTVEDYRPEQVLRTCLALILPGSE